MKDRLILALFALVASACATAKDSLEMQQRRLTLQQLRVSKVSTIEERDDHSRELERLLDDGALDNLSREEIRDTLGQADPCDAPVCQQQGFTRDDWYYEIGVNAAPDTIKQMPLVIVAWDTKGRVTRVYSLTTH